MKKLSSLLMLPAFTLVCTSSAMAAFGDNMSSRLGVDVGNSVQQQTYLDNYQPGGQNSLAVCIGFSTAVKLFDSDRVTTLLEMNNAWYQKVKTDSMGAGLVYRPKFGMFSGHGFHLAYDHTFYDDLNFNQVVVGHESVFKGFETRFNFYFATSDEQVDTSQSLKLRAMNGFDIMVSKSLSAVMINAKVSHDYHSDVEKDMTALTLGGDYKANDMLSLGAEYQYREGLDPNTRGYKVYASVPLFKNKEIQAVKRKLGVTLGSVVTTTD